MFQGRAKHLGRLPAPSGTEEQFREAQRRSGVGRIGLQRLAVAGFGLARTPEHFQHQGAVGQGPGARRTRSAIQHLVEERERSGRIAAHRESGGGGGPNAGGDSVAARIQYSAEESRGCRRIPSPQPRICQPARGAEGRSFKCFAGTGYEGSENLGGSGGISRQQMRARPADLEGRIPRVPNRSRLRDAGRLHVVAAVEQQPQQFHPVVAPLASRRARSAIHHGSGDNPVVVDGSQQQVAATRPQPVLLVAGQETLALGGPVGIRVLGEQLAESKAGLRILR